MSDTTSSHFVRQDLVPERPAPVKTTGLVGFVRTRLFNSPTNILITVVSVLLLWFTVVPALKFLLIDAVWRGADRNACLAENAGRAVGACWPFISAKFSQFIYGFYPEPERWRVNLTFFLAAILLLPLLIPRLPAKGINAALFFLAFPVVAFFLLHGGGIGGFAVSWTASLLSGIAAAFVILAILFFVIVNSTRRLPLRAVFVVTSLFLFVMGLKFVGEGLQEFQEQALIPYDMAPGASWLTALGLNPTWEALGAQIAVVLIAILGIVAAAHPHPGRRSGRS